MSTLAITLPKVKFPLGRIVITTNAYGRLDPEAIQQALQRHATGDWGSVGPEDARSNEAALKYGDRLMSVFGYGQGRFWIITESDRSVTTVLLPLDY